MSARRRLAAALLVAPTLAACGAGGALPMDVPPAPAALAVDGALVTLQRRALGAPYLLRAQVRAEGAALAFPTLPKVVAFAAYGDHVALLEQVADGAPGPGVLLDTFPVVTADAAQVRFEWRADLRAVGDGFAFADSEAPVEASTGAGWRRPLVAFEASFVRQAQVVDGTLRLEQVARLRAADGGADGVALALSLSPYRRSPAFEARPADPAAGLGYFDVVQRGPLRGTIVRLASRWDASQGPVRFVISDRFPAAQGAAVAAGIAYWNRVAQRPLVATEMRDLEAAPAAPREVAVHAVAGFSGAVALMEPDPWTAEIVGGSLWIGDAGVGAPPVGWAPQARRPAAAPAPLAIACAMAPPPTAAPLPAPPRPAPASPATLTAVAAHEAGHALGLRHNFAASGAGGGPAAPDAVASSVMDYLDRDDAASLGATVATAPLAYDVHALGWGYPVAAAPPPGPPPPYCSDWAADRVTFGCQRWDRGANPLAGAVVQLQRARQQQLATLVGAQGAVPEPPAALVLAQYLPLLRQDAGVLLASHQLAGRGRRPLGADALRHTADAVVGDALRAAGGLGALLGAALPLDASGAPVRGWVRPALAAAAAGWAAGADVPPGLGAAASAPSAGSLGELAAALEAAEVDGVLEALGGSPFAPSAQALSPYREALVDGPFLTALTRLAAHVVLAEEEADGAPAAAEAAAAPPSGGRGPAAYYPLSTRLRAASLFSAAHLPDAALAAHLRGGLQAALLGRLTAAGARGAERTLWTGAAADDPARRLADEWTVIDALGPGGPGVAP